MFLGCRRTDPVFKSTLLFSETTDVERYQSPVIATSCYFDCGSGGGCIYMYMCVCVVPPFFADVRLFICCDFIDVVNLLMSQLVFLLESPLRLDLLLDTI